MCYEYYFWCYGDDPRYFFLVTTEKGKGIVSAQSSAYKQATAKCDSMSKTIEVIDTEAAPSIGAWGLPTAVYSLSFECR